MIFVKVLAISGKLSLVSLRTCKLISYGFAINSEANASELQENPVKNSHSIYSVVYV